MDTTFENMDGILVAEKLSGKSDAYLKKILANQKRKELIEKIISDIQTKIDAEANEGGYFISYELFLSDDVGPTSKNFTQREIFGIINCFENKKYVINWYSEVYDIMKFKNKNKTKYVFEICWYDIKE